MVRNVGSRRNERYTLDVDVIYEISLATSPSTRSTESLTYVDCLMCSF